MTPGPKKLTGTGFRAFGAAALALACLAAYLPALGGRFIWDDWSHVTKPQLVSWRGLGRIWFDLGATQQYYPVLHSAFWVEYHLWGYPPAAYHLANVLLHATAACLFACVLLRLWAPRPWAAAGAWFAAALFALHPVCVESVAWVSEEKNTLSTVFYLLSALAYLKWRGIGGEPAAPGARPRGAGRPGLYWLGLFLFVLALLSKSVTATLPAALLVVLWWKNGRLGWREDVAPLVPWLGAGVASGLFTAWVERTYIGAEGAAFALSPLQRCLLAGRVVWFYLGKLAWPADLMFVYPHWRVDAGAWRQYAFPAALLGLAAALWRLGRRSRGPLAALLLFVGTLFPALGFLNAYPFVFSYVADHFQYQAMLAVAGLAAAGWGMWLVSPRGARRAPLAAAAAALGLLGVLTFRQCRMYRDAETLYRTTIARNPGAWLAWGNLGVILADSGRLREAVACYETSLRLNPDNPVDLNNLGVALFRLHDYAGAVPLYEKALRFLPNDARTHYDLGRALAGERLLPEAIAEFRKALALDPRIADAHANLGVALGMSGDLPGAIDEIARALRLDPYSAEAHNDLGNALAMTDRIPEAVAEFRRAVALNPRMADAHANLGMALSMSGDLPQAIAEIGQSLRLDPSSIKGRLILARVLQQAGRFDEAQAQLDAARRLEAAAGQAPSP